MQVYRPNAAPNGVYFLEKIVDVGVTRAAVTLTANKPADATTGYAPGCTLADLQAAKVYINTGTKASATWIQVSSSAFNLANLTSSVTELNTLHSQTVATSTVPVGAGITDGTGTIFKSSAELHGSIYKTQLMIDLTGDQSSTTDLDIIGSGTNPAFIGPLTAAQQGTTILIVRMACLEAPATGVTDIDLYSATEATGKFDDAVTGLTETALITSGGA